MAFWTLQLSSHKNIVKRPLSFHCICSQLPSSPWGDPQVIPGHAFLPEVCLTTCTFLLAHDTGLVTLQVAFNNQIISNSVVFEYKARALPTLPSSQHDWLSLDGKKRAIFFNKAHCMVGL